MQIGQLLHNGNFKGLSPSTTPLVAQNIRSEKCSFVNRGVRLYEQEQRRPFASPLLGLYVRRWVRWVTASLIYAGVI